MELLAGCGFNREKQIPTVNGVDWTQLVTIDSNPDCNPDKVWNLNNHPLPFEDNTFDEIHMYECLEHIGTQGDVKGFFKEFRDYWRILKPNGLFCATTPSWKGIWAWGDPGHTRVISEGTLAFLIPKSYDEELGKTSKSDYRNLLGNMSFEVEWAQYHGTKFLFVMKAIKNGR